MGWFNVSKKFPMALIIAIGNNDKIVTIIIEITMLIVHIFLSDSVIKYCA
jgi:hypothetical protein